MMQPGPELLLHPFSTYQYDTPNDFDDVFSSFPEELFDHESIIIHDGFGEISTRDMDEICNWIYSNEGSSSFAQLVSADEWSPCPSLESTQNTVNPQGKEMKLDNEMSLLHLSRAYGEAMADEKKGPLAEVIVESINEKSSLEGNAVERVAYHMFKSKDKDGEYIRQESRKNFAAAFGVLYGSLICGRFAHNAANSAIIDSIPDDVTVLHVVDFDIGEGIQWPALMEALSRKPKLVRLTTIKLEGEDFTSSCWEIEETKRRLEDDAKQYGISLHVEEKCIEDFTAEMMVKRRRRKNGGSRDWLVFNLMVALPHMGQRRRRRNVVKFLKMAEELLGDFDGVLAFGDGEAGDGLGECVRFPSYFGKLLTHHHALFEALERNFPVYLREARMGMECTFLAPFMCPIAWFKEWEEMVKGDGFESILEGRRVSRESLEEAKVMVNEGENSCRVTIEGLRENEVVLRWKETILVRVSTFCSRR